LRSTFVVVLTSHNVYRLTECNTKVLCKLVVFCDALVVNNAFVYRMLVFDDPRCYARQKSCEAGEEYFVIFVFVVLAPELCQLRARTKGMQSTPVSAPYAATTRRIISMLLFFSLIWLQEQLRLTPLFNQFPQIAKAQLTR
jgi:hypothetical protein